MQTMLAHFNLGRQRSDGAAIRQADPQGVGIEPNGFRRNNH
jgi:hypothetical protein